MIHELLVFKMSPKAFVFGIQEYMNACFVALELVFPRRANIVHAWLHFGVNLTSCVRFFPERLRLIVVVAATKGNCGCSPRRVATSFMSFSHDMNDCISW